MRNVCNNVMIHSYDVLTGHVDGLFHNIYIFVDLAITYAEAIILGRVLRMLILQNLR